MLEIQETCAELQRHEDISVVCAAKHVLELDKKRELEYQASLFEKDQAISLLKVEKKALTSDVELLKFYLNNANANLYDAKSEKSESEQPKRTQETAKTDENDDDNACGGEAQEHKETPETADNDEGKGGKTAKSFPKHLPRRFITINPNPDDLCDCGCGRRNLPPEKVERLEFIPARVEVVQEIYNKSVCRNCGHFAYAKRPDRLFEQSRYGTSLTVAAIIDKFADGLPYYRQTTRQLETLPLVDEVFELMKQSRFVGLKKSPMGKALAYALTLEDGLRLFLSDGLLEISNNSVENIIRHVAIVRKNALFVGSEAGGENWAIAQSIIATCKLNDLNPEEYMKWVFDQMEAKLPRSQYHKLLPWNCPLRRNKSKK